MRKNYIILLLVITLTNAQFEDRLLAVTTVFSEQDLMTIQERSQIRGDYKDVINESSGALIVNANILTFYGSQFTNCPLRNSLYFVVNGANGYVQVPNGSLMQVDLLQNYEINTISFWLYDLSDQSAQYTITIQVKIKGQAALSTVFPTTANPVNTINKGFYRIKFDDAQVSSIYFKADGTDLKLIKVQAFYAF